MREYKIEKDYSGQTYVWFTNRVENVWNMLSRHVGADPIGSFKRRLGENMDRDDNCIWTSVEERRNCFV